MTSVDKNSTDLGSKPVSVKRTLNPALYNKAIPPSGIMFPITTMSYGFRQVSQIAVMSRLFSMTNPVNPVVLLRIDWAYVAHNLALGLHSTAIHAAFAAAIPAAATGTAVVAAVAATVCSNGVLCGTTGDDVTVTTSALTLRCRHTLR